MPLRGEVAACLDDAWATSEPVWALLDGCGGRRWLVIVTTPSGGCGAELFESDADDEHLVQRTCLTAELAPESCDELVVSECGGSIVHDVHPESQGE